jgi:integrase
LPVDLPPVILAEAHARAPLLGLSVEDYAKYAAECLAGHRFPDLADAWLRSYCRDHFRLREVIELYKRIHIPTLKNNPPLISRLRNYFTPLLSLKLSEITRPMVVAWYHENMPKSRIQAIGSVKTLRAIYNKAIEWELYDGKNPAVGVKGMRRDTRSRFVQPGDEMKKLLDALMVEPDVVQAFFLTCLLCGCRGGEARHMCWGDLDFTRNLWHKPMTKTGVPHTIPIPDEIVGRLKALPRDGMYVFGSRRGEQPWPATTTHKYWKRTRDRAGLHDVTIHDLRRTWASWAAMDGENLSVIATVLNHASLQHTQIYARLNAAPIYKAMAKQATSIMANEGTAAQEAAKAARLPDPFEDEDGSALSRAARPRPVPPARPMAAAMPSREDRTPRQPIPSAHAEGLEWPG